MKTKIFLTVSALFLLLWAVAQKPTIELTFTAVDSAAYLQFDSTKIMNLTQGGETVLYWPDTVLVLTYQVGISENNNDVGSFQVFQNYPNPVEDQTTISIYVPEKDKVSMIVTDMLGRAILMTDRVLDKGTHLFQFMTGHGNLFFFYAQWRRMSGSIKILHYYIGQHGLWWTSTDGNISSAWNRYLSYNNPKVDRDYGDNKEFGFSVRCIRD